MSNWVFPLVLAILGFGGLLYFFNKKIEELKTPQDEAPLKMMLQVIGDLRRDVESGHGKNREEMTAKLNQIQASLTKHQTDNTQSVQQQLKQSSLLIEDVTKKLSTLESTNKQVVGFAEQMRTLENILKNPKQRGVLGEIFLEKILSNLFPPNQFQMQYKMRNGEIVDAVIFQNELVIPIDAKFSLEKYNLIMEETDKIRREDLEKAFKADVKKRIDETAKYVRPSEQTTDFAFMFIPAEGVFYNLMIHSVGTLDVNSQNLVEYAASKRVTIVSPGTLTAYLQTILQGIHREERVAKIQEILDNLVPLHRHMNAYNEYFQKLGRQIGTTVSTYNLARSEFKKIDKDVYKLTDGKTGGQIEMLVLEDKPVELE
ncbi:MAG: DNA recombination protein RmuC [Candidatus Gracilibacteria bacterium]|jgi:DNA recombination protein RmuC